MRKIRDFVYEWLDREESFIFWMVLLNATASWVTYSAFLDGTYAFIKEFLILACDIAISFLTVCFIDLILYIALKKLKLLHNAVKFILLAVNIVMFCTDIFTLYHYSLPLNSIMFEFITMTNIRESTEFLQAYLTNSNFWIFTAVIIASAFIVRFIWVKVFNSNPKLRFATCSMFLVLGIFALGRQFFIYGGLGFSRAANSVGIMRLANILQSNRMNLQEYDKMFNDISKNVTLTKNESKIPYIIYVLGESTTKNHMSLYGYNLPTNPLLSRRNDFKGGVKFLLLTML